MENGKWNLTYLLNAIKVVFFDNFISLFRHDWPTIGTTNRF